jgi:transcriptional regulator with XRE-family HTH domain
MSLRNLIVSKGELVGELERLVERASQAEIARQVKVKAPLISNVLNGKANPTGKLLKWLGYERVVVYRRRV